MGRLWFAGGSRGFAWLASTSGAVLVALILLGSGALGLPAALAKPSPYLNGDRNLIDVYAAVEGAKLGVLLPGGPEKFITLKESSASVLKTPTGAAGGETECVDSSGGDEGPAAGCTIELAVLPHKNGELRDTIIHETFHVFQAVMSQTLANFHSGLDKDWLIEGSATWVESDLVKHDALAQEEWRVYLSTPGIPLFSRTGTKSSPGALNGYSAVGFFGHMASSNKSPWARFPQMFKAKGSAAAYAAAGVDTPFLDNEASVFFRDPKLGPEWDQAGPNVPSAHEVGFRPNQLSLGSRRIAPLVVKPYADGAYDLTITGLPMSHPVLELKVLRGNVRIRSTSGGSVNEVDPQDLRLCANLTICSCPGQPNRYLKFQRGDLAITGGPTGAEVRLVAREPCEQLLRPVSCTAVLPDFVQFIQGVAGKPAAIESHRADGTVASACAFLEKGTETPVGEGQTVFNGLVAPVVSVLRSSSIAGAVKYFELMSVPVAHFHLTRLRIGDEAVLRTEAMASTTGIEEFSSSAIVRVNNIVASYAIYGTPGNNEADLENSIARLVQVAARL